MDRLNKWIFDNKLDVKEISDRIYSITDIGIFYLLGKKDGKIFDDEFRLILDEEDKKIECSFYLFEFGNKFYYTPKNHILHPDMLLFKYLGKANVDIENEFAYLGIHGKYEIMNGSRGYEDWCKKAKFLGYDELGICERNTLAGVIAFQLACSKNNIKAILGESIIVRLEDGKIYNSKVYVMNDEGWKNALLINKNINVDNGGKFVSEQCLLEHGKGLIFIFGWDFPINKTYIEKYKKIFEDIYYQIDSVIWDSDEIDKRYLLQIKNYIVNYYLELNPVLINDSYYLDKEDYYIKKKLNDIVNRSYEGLSKNQHFKTLDENFEIWDGLFNKNTDFALKFISLAILNANKISKKIEFQIEFGKFHLPKFNYSDLSEEFHFKSNKDLFWNLIETGIKEKLKGVNDLQKYLDRVNEEVRIIEKGEYVDYFLILWDIIKWSNEQGILTGVGRGSAGGSLIAYLLDITRLDPLKYDLLFERFLNEGRIGHTMPDIDIDFESNRRNEVKRYMEKKYGGEQVCSVGTYPEMKLKGVIKDLARLEGIPHFKVNYITKILDDKYDGRFSQGSFLTIFENAVKIPAVKKFIQENFDLINSIPVCLNQLRTVSVHPCATLILPKNKSIYEWIPVRKMENELIAEWEGEYLEEAGFLKEDILGISQLDKFRFIIDLIKETIGEDIDIYSFPIDEIGVFEMFQKGYNEDVFHFGSKNLINYCQQVQPKNITELITINAIYRPGPIASGAHEDYVKLKHKEKYATYDFGLKEVTKDTYGLWVFQEQIMKAVQVLGGLSPIEADDVRKAMGKISIKLIKEYKIRFIEGAIKRKCPKKEAEEIWEKLEVFGGYGFNKSHAAAYSITGYICQYLKWKYPVQFWTAAFEFAKDDQLPNYVSEIYRSNTDVYIVAPDINKSKKNFYTDFKEKKIYWSLLKIKEVGEVAASVILEEREKNGEFYSLSEFCKRIPKAKVNKKVIEHLILAGAFDIIHDIKNPCERMKLIEEYRKLMSIIRIDESKDIFQNKIKIKKNYWWVMKQNEISGLGYIDFVEVIKDTPLKKHIDSYLDATEFFLNINEKKKVVIGGIVNEIKERNSKKGQFAEIWINSNNNHICVVIHYKIWEKVRSLLIESNGQLIIFYGEIIMDTWKKHYVLQVNKSDEIVIVK